MNDLKLRYRQVHLDFHTSPDIQGVGADFDPEEFVQALLKAEVNSITCFARCHHGMLYYESALFPERVHPHLENRNLLKQQIEICHQHGIRVPIYLTVQWDHYTAQRHPEWLVMDENGHPRGTKIYEAGFYRDLCLNSPYRDFLKANTKEILDLFNTDGLFFDIVFPLDCSCNYCRQAMLDQGLDPADKATRLEFGQWVVDDFKQDMTAFIRQYHANCSIFYNKGHVGTTHRGVKDAYTHFELESLPSGGWGYTHFPVTMLYARNLGKDCLAQTGKFHTMWGDFHSFKNQYALEFECFRMLALNAKCMIGDQLEPNGRLSQPVYDLIGSVYQEIALKEAWCEDAKPLTDIGVLTPEEFYGAGSSDLPPAIMGITRMLTESSHQFDILDSASPFDSYKVIVLPDQIEVNEELAGKLEEYLANGGSVIASHEAGLRPDKSNFAFAGLGVELVGEAPFSPDFLVPSGVIGAGLPETEHVMYMKGLEVKARAGSEILSEVKVPYFNREWNHFCSHKHTPSSGVTGYPGVVKRGQAIYFMHPLFTIYNEYAPRWCKQLFLNALSVLLPEPLIRHKGPTTLMVALNEQPLHERQVLHLLHYIPERRCKNIDIIEDRIPLHQVELSVKANKSVSSVRCVPQNAPLSFEVVDGRVNFTLPLLDGHQMVEIS